MTVSDIIAVVLVLIGAGALIYLLPQLKALIPQIQTWLEAHTTAEQRQILAELAAQAVGAAEQIFGSKTGEQKKAYAMDLLAKLMPDIDEDVRSAAIEDEVFKINKAKAE